MPFAVGLLLPRARPQLDQRRRRGGQRPQHRLPVPPFSRYLGLCGEDEHGARTRRYGSR